MDNMLDLVETVERAKKYDSDAFSQLYDLYFDKIYNYIYYKVGNCFEAEDIAGQVFLKALEKISEFEWCGAPFSSWLFRIASNQIADYFRSGIHETVAISEELSLMPHDGCNPEQFAIHESNRNEIIKAIKTLTEEQQQVIIMRFIAGMTNKEVAKSINKNVGAVKALQHRATRALSRALGRVYSEA